MCLFITIFIRRLWKSRKSVFIDRNFNYVSTTNSEGYSKSSGQYNLVKITILSRIWWIPVLLSSLSVSFTLPHKMGHGCSRYNICIGTHPTHTWCAHIGNELTRSTWPNKETVVTNLRRFKSIVHFQLEDQINFQLALYGYPELAWEYHSNFMATKWIIHAIVRNKDNAIVNLNLFYNSGLSFDVHFAPSFWMFQTCTFDLIILF